MRIRCQECGWEGTEEEAGASGGDTVCPECSADSFEYLMDQGGDEEESSDALLDGLTTGSDLGTS